MKQRYAGLATCLVLLTAICAWGAPSLVADEPVYDFGSVPQGQNVRHTFQFINTGDEPLVIDKVRSSCGCTAALVSSEILQPGETGELQASFDSARFRGQVDKTIYLYSNDPLNRVHKFSVTGEVRELFGLAPRQVNFGSLAPGRRVEKSVTVSNLLREDLQTVSVQTTSPELAAGFPDMLPARGTAGVKVLLQPKPGQTRFSGYVLVRLQGEKTYELRLPVYATVQEP